MFMLTNMRPKYDIALFYINNEEKCLGLYKVLYFLYISTRDKGKGWTGGNAV